MTNSPAAWPPPPSVATRVSPQVRHLLAPNASSWTYEGTNSWIIGADGSAETVIVDPGTEDRAHLEALASAAMDDGGRVSAIVLTHAHPDHSDGARALSDLVGAPVVARAPEHADIVPDDDAALTVGPVPLRLLHTPGHSDDSLCIDIVGTSVLVTGDTILGGRSAGVFGDLGDYLATLERLVRLSAYRRTTALPGHGPVVDDLHAAASRVLGVRRARLEEIVSAVGAGAVTVRELVGRVYPAIDPTRIPSAVATVLANLDYLLTAERGGIADPGARDALTREVERMREQMRERMTREKGTP